MLVEKFFLFVLLYMHKWDCAILYSCIFFTTLLSLCLFTEWLYFSSITCSHFHFLFIWKQSTKSRKRKRVTQGSGSKSMDHTHSKISRKVSMRIYTYSTSQYISYPFCFSALIYVSLISLGSCWSSPIL